ncbi:hypothetical protein WCE02_08265 [Pseudomonas juntendi]|uniref:hypothetical protein n=1 Tax=Pseudomonas TaxID=286 RepID=UPI001554FE6A|nr:MULTISPECIES: hypothetical protein [Pseudomonas]MEB3902948.1 hypothetical protein [Pseudomonas putida]UBM23601.1 hypothetical protein K8374_14475 [Pseudomonas sp. p1(2021b)]
MKTTTRCCLTLIVCAFAAIYVAALTRPLPMPLSVAYYCQPNFQPCYMPVPSAMRLLP